MIHYQFGFLQRQPQKPELVMDHETEVAPGTGVGVPGLALIGRD
jgi:hypothetical protein